MPKCYGMPGNGAIVYRGKYPNVAVFSDEERQLKVILQNPITELTFKYIHI